MATRGEAPYKKVITHGFVVGQDRKKISKSSDGKPQTSDMYVGKWGADIVRLWISSVDYQNDIPISEDILSHIANAYRGVRNTIMYQLGNLYDFDRARDAVPPEKLDALDKWAIFKTARFLEETEKAYDAYEFHKVYKLLDNFCGVTLSRVYHDILKDRLYTYAANSPERRSSQTAIDIISDALIKAARPRFSPSPRTRLSRLKTARSFPKIPCTCKTGRKLARNTWTPMSAQEWIKFSPCAKMPTRSSKSCARARK